MRHSYDGFQKLEAHHLTFTNFDFLRIVCLDACSSYMDEIKAWLLLMIISEKFALLAPDYEVIVADIWVGGVTRFCKEYFH